MTTKQRLSASVDADVLAAVERAVEQGAAPNVSAFVSDALRAKLVDHKRLAALRDYIEEYEREHGAFTEEEMREVERTMRARAIRTGPLVAASSASTQSRGARRAKRAP